MTALTKEARDALPGTDFAVPGKRVLPIHDEPHIKMAWAQIADVRGLTDDEKKAARVLILAKCQKLGMTTKDLKISAMSWDFAISAMSLDVPDTPDHPNKTPFTGILVRLDQPSDEPPHGSFGMKTILTRAAAESALSSILGMAVNYKPDLKGHDKTAKIGVIDSATIESDASGDYIKIGGFLYASDFKDVVASIQSKKDDLGFSFEAERIYVSDSKVPNSLQIDKLTFTGAAILMKKSAAYQTTSIAAAAETEKKLEKEQFDAIMAKLTEIDGRVTKVEAGSAASIEAASVLEKVKPHTDGIRKIADKMAAAGIGGHATRGHVHILNHMADSMEAEACKGVMASTYSPPSMYAAADPAVTTDPAVKTEIAGIKASMASLTTMLQEIKAAGTSTNAPQRQTIPPVLTSLLAKANIALPDGDGKLTITKVDELLAAANLPTDQRLQIKIGLRNAGKLSEA